MSRQKYLVIPNKGMPNSCWECPCLRHDSIEEKHMWHCGLTYKTFDVFCQERLNDCPLEEVYLDPEAIAYGELKKSKMSEWMPVSDRLPEKCALVILTLNCLGHRWLDAAIHVQDGIFESLVKLGTMYTSNGEDKPVAWVQIPEPYREEDKE